MTKHKKHGEHRLLPMTLHGDIPDESLPLAKTTQPQASEVLTNMEEEDVAEVPIGGELEQIEAMVEPVFEEMDIAPLTSRNGRRYTAREQMVVSSVLEKALVNLYVLARVQVGDKLIRDPRGFFCIQKPSWFTIFRWTLHGADKRQTQEMIEDLIGGTENNIRSGAFNDPRTKSALVNAVHGMRNLQETYKADMCFVSAIDVLLHRLKYHLGLNATQML